MAVDLKGALDVVGATTDVVEKLAKLKEKLSKNPNAAAAALGAALAEVRRTYLAVDAEVTRFLSRVFDPDAFNPGNQHLLVELDGGAIRVRAHEARGHCARIRGIYQQHLNKWFDKVFDKAELLIIGEVFDTLQNDDQQSWILLESVATFLAGEARALVDAMLAVPPDEAAARARLRAAYGQLRPMRDKLRALVSQLEALEAEFIEISGAI